MDLVVAGLSVALAVPALRNEEATGQAENCRDGAASGRQKPICFGPILVGTAIVFGISTVVGVMAFSAARPCRRDDGVPDNTNAAAVESAQQRLVERERNVKNLVATAAAAAHNGDCTTVVKIDPQLRALDPEVHKTVFLRDRVIAQCLVPPTETQPAEAENRPSEALAVPAASEHLPKELDRTSLSAGLSSVAAEVKACGEASSQKGLVRLAIKVAGDGRVVNVTIKSALDVTLGRCVAAAMEKATFAKTQMGGSFSYPFTF